MKRLNLPSWNSILYPVFLLLVLTLSALYLKDPETKWCPGPHLHSVDSNTVETNFCPSACSQISQQHWVHSDTFKNKTLSLEAKNRVPLAAQYSNHCIQSLSEGQELSSFVYDFRFCFLHHAAANYIIKTSKVKQSNCSEKAHGDHLLESFSDGSHWCHPTGQGGQHVPIRANGTIKIPLYGIFDNLFGHLLWFANTCGL